jgi:mannose-6-phosphate isomerase-like protein (cupin superfamily)
VPCDSDLCLVTSDIGDRMNHVFEPRGFFTVPDGTDVSPILDTTDINQADVQRGTLGDVSVATGRILPRVRSAVHVHPVVTQVTYVLSGRLTVRMKNDDAGRFYDLVLRPGQAVVTRPGTLFQLRNDSDAVAEVLYIVSPSFVFEMDSHAVRYSDAVIVSGSWEELEARNYDVPVLSIRSSEARERREEAKRRLEAKNAGIQQS